jgi:trigger factor
MRADEFAQQVVNAGQLGSLMSEVLRGKALAHVLEHATITDSSGRPVDLDSLTKEFEAPPTGAAAQDLDDLDDDDEDDDESAE